MIFRRVKIVRLVNIKLSLVAGLLDEGRLGSSKAGHNTPSPPIILPAIQGDELSDDFLGVYKGITLFSPAASTATLET